MLHSSRNASFAKYAHRVRSLKGMSIADKLGELETLCKDLHSSSNQDFIAKCNIVREVLKDLHEQKERPSTETLGCLMHEVSGCLPNLSDIGRNAVVLADVAACLTMLSLSNIEGYYMDTSEEKEENMTQWVVNTFIRGPFKQAKKRAGDCHKCFPVIRAISAVLSEWPTALGVRRSMKVCLRNIVRIIEHDKLVLTAREGFGILYDCITVLQTDIPEETFEKMIAWSLEGVKHSSTWETRFYGVKILAAILQLPFEEDSDIALFLKSKDRKIVQVLKDANSDRNRQVKDLAQEVLDIYEIIRQERGICTISPKESCRGSKSDAPDSSNALNAPHGKQVKLPQLPDKLLEEFGDLPPEFYANVYRGTPRANTDDPCKPNDWDILACEQHGVWQKAPSFRPEDYDWSTWWWPLSEELDRLAKSLRKGEQQTLIGETYVLNKNQ
eukprot:g8161.t1